MKNNFFISLLLISLIFIVGCSESDEPPESNVVGAVGNFYVSLEDQYTEPVALRLISGEGRECALGEDISFSYIIEGDDYVKKYMYLWDQSENEWVKHDLDGVKKSRRSSYLIAPVTKNFTMSCANALALTDGTTDSGIYARAYSCTKQGRKWDCHNNKWQIEVFNLTERVTFTNVSASLNTSFTDTNVSASLNTSFTSYDFNCDGVEDSSDVSTISSYWKNGTVIDVNVVTSTSCEPLGTYLGALWANGTTSVSINEVTYIGSLI